VEKNYKPRKGKKVKHNPCPGRGKNPRKGKSIAFEEVSEEGKGVSLENSSSEAPREEKLWGRKGRFPKNAEKKEKNHERASILEGDCKKGGHHPSRRSARKKKRGAIKRRGEGGFPPGKGHPGRKKGRSKESPCEVWREETPSFPPEKKRGKVAGGGKTSSIIARRGRRRGGGGRITLTKGRAVWAKGEGGVQHAEESSKLKEERGQRD